MFHLIKLYQCFCGSYEQAKALVASNHKNAKHSSESQESEESSESEKTQN